MLGTRWSRRAYELREFLARNQVPYQWLDVEAADSDPEVRRALDTLTPEQRHFPTVLLTDGGCLPDPSHAELAGRIGFNTRAGAASYDLIILGGGPAGLAAGVYGASEGLHTVIVEREAPGGQAGLSARIENYLGFPSGLSGGDLARRAVAQARRFGVEILAPQEAVSLRIQDPYRIVRLADGSEISAEVSDLRERSWPRRASRAAYWLALVAAQSHARCESNFHCGDKFDGQSGPVGSVNQISPFHVGFCPTLNASSA